MLRENWEVLQFEAPNIVFYKSNGVWKKSSYWLSDEKYPDIKSICEHYSISEKHLIPIIWRHKKYPIFEIILNVPRTLYSLHFSSSDEIADEIKQFKEWTSWEEVAQEVEELIVLYGIHVDICNICYKGCKSTICDWEGWTKEECLYRLEHTIAEV